ncbi:hypothetical protein A2803_05890 [Candidatus Woesebacteria bacterium RIFCSPHIGHO2_01_FULL_44_21]|uniref:Methyltransferase type 11 domain-containing protein n=1 Tax=Candidatus Woesebacteria bacterium RIFCSPHIGHO2_01_FULL_44_21 TaxID=1802503 RepID=A0A1F7Z1J8_9BACT|nr:MAG: hypothetical protein A2803_05890 [Candidatus Woesebacteria bacterium RIFCSPHIGHO2_01_FULL_44_21]OGM71087.1 MAG: hypothetical protein A2897_02535 [Candidatus Woesebacteria bacterium RIFCSPLOWO2_01_FULL_44_24b]
MAAAYDDYDYPRYWEKRAYEHQSEVIVLKDFFKRLGGNKKILEIGAGYGRLAKVYNKYCSEATLVDPSLGILQKAKTYLNGEAKKVTFVRSTLKNLPAKLTKKFDVVVLVRVMHHIKDPELAIKTASRYLPHGGYLILEFANKLHGKAILKNLLSGNFTFPIDIFPQDKRSTGNIKKRSILFLNHHPDIVEATLRDNGFKIIDKRSVSNIRNSSVKKIFSLKYLTRLEELIQKPLAKFNFGPSIFILAKKK